MVTHDITPEYIKDLDSYCSLAYLKEIFKGAKRLSLEEILKVDEYLAEFIITAQFGEFGSIGRGTVCKFLTDFELEHKVDLWSDYVRDDHKKYKGFIRKLKALYKEVVCG